MTLSLDAVLKLRAAGRVTRFHTFPHHGRHTVAEHCYHMVTLLLGIHPRPSVGLVHYIMFHDAAEGTTGDVPNPAKRVFPTLAKAMYAVETAIHDALGVMQGDLTAEEYDWIEALDIIELIMWCHDQANLGNKLAVILMNDCQERYQVLVDNGNMPAEVKLFVQNARLLS
jgi:5'-deoxynucleotidase YfbR-like HD superfamily hydrolase